MANFEAQVRVSHRDVAGLVLSCERSDIIEDINNPGFVKEWINRAPGLPSQPAIRQPGDPAPTYLGGRFSNPKQLDQTLQPTLVVAGGNRRVQFDRARSTFLQTELLVANLPNVARPLAVGFQFEQRPDGTNNQVIWFDEAVGTFKGSRLNSGGDAEVLQGGASTTVAGDLPNGTYLFTGETGGTSLWEQDGGAFGTGSATSTAIVTGERMFLGRDTAGNYLDGILDSMYIWACELSPLTQDLIWRTLNADGTDFATDSRPVINLAVWTDVTGDPLLDQYDRLRPQTGFPHRYILVSIPSGGALHRVQVAAAVNGIVRPDSELGGDLFTYSFTEFPVIPPTVTQDATWSSVIDFDVRNEGHYTLIVTRPSGGSFVLHFDVQVV